MPHAVALLAAAVLAVACSGGGSSGSAGPVTLPSPTLVAIKAPPCATDVSRTFVSQNAVPVDQAYPTMPNTDYYLVVRYLGTDSLSAGPAFDFGRFPADWPVVADRGLPLTGLTVPDPKGTWQRSRSADATPATASAFQANCQDAGSYLDTATFPRPDITGGGPHALYGFSFNDPPPQPVFDGGAATEFVLQASVEIPYLRVKPFAGSTSATPVGQVVLAAYFRDRNTRRAFAVIAGLFDNRFTDGTPYPPYVAHDTQTPFASQALADGGPWVARYADSAAFGGAPFAGLRPYRLRLTQAAFARLLADVNAYCQGHRTDRFCGAAYPDGSAFSPAILDYDLTDFGVLHEIVRGALDPHLAMGVHVSAPGAYRLR